MKPVLVVLALLLAAATALPLLRIDQWWIRIFDFPRAQITIAGIVLLSWYIWSWNRNNSWDSLVLGLLVLAVGYQAVKILPYTVLAPREVLDAASLANDATISLLVANVLMENRKSEVFLNLIHDYDPDLILTVEADDWWEKALRKLEADYPHTLKAPQSNTYGMLVHSRLEMVDAEIRFLLKDTIPSMHMQVVLPSSDRVFMHFVHPAPPNPRYAMETTERDAELLIVARESEQREAPMIVSGDFNDVAWSYTTALFQKASGLLDPRIGRGIYNTYNANSLFMRWPLDHVFHSDHFKLVRMETGPAWGSDHFPVFIKLSLEPGAAADQQEPETNQADAKRVDKMIEDGRQHIEG